MQVQVLNADDKEFKVHSVKLYSLDGGRFDFGFEDKYYTSVAPGRNQFSTASYEDPNIAKILTAIDKLPTSCPSCSTSGCYDHKGHYIGG